ncbi:MAG: crossover junction endodeoxyribonuclease RuvC [Cyanobacteria bacterium K_Offshore_surface_m2_239]|nr:crossover junction endodeoxyribonuclease RuvC [Cyanobacteria bacterium K_Offshore_surface_m2_239]
MDSILCLDLGTKTGWARRGPDGRIWSGHENFTPSRHDSCGVRYHLFRRFLRQQGIKHINLVYYEAVNAHKGVAAAQVYGGFCSLLMTERVVPGFLHYQGVPVGTIKKAATGQGNASKDDVKDAVFRLFSLDKKRTQTVTYDEADALALLHYVISTEHK